MATQIHPTAVVESGAELGVDVEIGPLAYVGAGVTLGDGTRLHHHAGVEGNTVLGAGCEVFPFANIGAKTQDLKFNGGNPGVRIGARNVFREYVTIHAATDPEAHTILGDDNVLLAHGHVAHDCVLGSHIIASNNTGIAGHCIVEDYVVFGAMSGVHQFCRIGAHSMISAYAKIVQDIAPYMIADGQPAVIRAINKIGLERRGFTSEQLDRVKQVFRVLFREGLNRSQALDKLRAHPQSESAEIAAVLSFAATSERGLAPGA
ncbi:acyl-ACP--UDP-N-acetylglucosamine O-acyltransferase [Actomonas aquatica]|uniref:Acyl-ACP--UDP-N-acetylglucosamine O-acyltransferase n=1 Tax=Actomonas aquatica TaxID=2866162 RepID=A0ABZ1CCE6_9BACT|nr:acyl-ACP--UDP-N-acetylglucosamine O-acyltransferase [Opitutus sp. WL0086]WRQ89117.1 acyl-ACP--UDP-N-acetylglucosamine O-acyltransferase [Opitutus sp. WL0086]